LDDLERPVLKLMCFQSPPQKKNNDRRIYTISDENVANDSSFYKCKVYANIRWGSLERGADRLWSCRKQRCSAVLLAKFHKSRPLLLYRIYSSSSAFQWFQNAWPWMTRNSSFTLNSGLRVGMIFRADAICCLLTGYLPVCAASTWN